MKRNFVEPQMKVMAVNMKENIAWSKTTDVRVEKNSSQQRGTYNVRHGLDASGVDVIQDTTTKWDGTTTYTAQLPYSNLSSCYTRQ